MAGAFTRSKVCMKFSNACVNFKVGSETLLQSISINQCKGMPTCVLYT